MQIHSAESFDRPVARLNNANPDDPFAVVEHGSAFFATATTPAECDAMIAAWTEAKRLLTDALLRRDGEALGHTIAADEDLEPAADVDRAIAADLDEQTGGEK